MLSTCLFLMVNFFPKIFSLFLFLRQFLHNKNVPNLKGDMWNCKVYYIKWHLLLFLPRLHLVAF